jgi:hypothetical protein
MSDDAVISDDGKYRYILSRSWLTRLPYGEKSYKGSVLWIMLNPSTADEFSDDATIRKCRGFTLRWGYTSLVVVNLFAFRATQPKDLKLATDPYGPRNADFVAGAIAQAPLIIAAWGNHGGKDGDEMQVRLNHLETKRVRCLGATKSRQPKHPLMLSYDTEREALPYVPRSFDPRDSWEHPDHPMNPRNR